MTCLLNVFCDCHTWAGYAQDWQRTSPIFHKCTSTARSDHLETPMRDSLNCKNAVVRLLLQSRSALPTWNVKNLLRCEFTPQAVELAIRHLHNDGYLILVRRPNLSVSTSTLCEDCYLANTLASQQARDDAANQLNLVTDPHFPARRVAE
jgi:hypothetical protein